MFRAQISSETEGLRGKMLNDETDLKNQNSTLLEKFENEKLELEAKLKGKFTQSHIKFYKWVSRKNYFYNIQYGVWSFI